MATLTVQFAGNASEVEALLREDLEENGRDSVSGASDGSFPVLEDTPA